ncbi:MAG: GNAT family N-acetyltransferase [Clostridia bacterium]|nr:GNAT family N-acetyltransferase [Clostridia bacterium]
MQIETKRLFLREMTEQDFDALYRIWADPVNMQHYPYVFDEARVRSWIRRNIARYQTLGFGLWAVCRKDTGALIGDCGLTMQSINGQILPEIGYHIRADQQQKGYATEAAIAVRDWTFRNTPFQAVYSYMKHTNAPSVRTALAYGCKQIDAYPDDANGITKVFAISRDEWARLSL